MSTPFKYISAFGCMLALASCSEDSMRIGEGEEEQNLPIILNAAYPTATRASDAGFEGGDRMGVYVLDYTGDIPQDMASDEIHAANVRFDFNDSDNSWRGTTNIYWTSKDTPADIIGYYPFVSNIEDAKSVTHTILRRQDQSGSDAGMGGYEASDFLWAKASKVLPSDSRVDLTFGHLMAGVRVTLAEGSGFNAGEWNSLEKEVLIPNIRPTVNINMESGSVGEATGDPISVIPYLSGEDWRGVVVPQTVEAGKNVIDVTVDGVSYHLTKNEPVVYTGGKLNTFTITVNKRTDSGKYDFQLTDEAITAWLDDVDFRDGIIRNYVVVHVEKKGELASCIKDTKMSENDITNLKIIGELDESDFQYMREKFSRLSSLNLSESEVYENDVRGVIPANALSGKDRLTHIVFPKYLKVIGSCAFTRCGLIGDLIIPEGVTHIGTNNDTDSAFPGHWGGGDGVFTECMSLVGSLTLPSTLEFIESGAFCRTSLSGELIIPENVRFIGSIAFDSTKFTGALSLPEGLEEIGTGAFYRVPLSGTLSIPQGITNIRTQTFSGGKYTSVTFPEGLIAIGDEAFIHSDIRGELMLPSSLKRLGNRAFEECKISSIIFPKSLSYMGDGCFASNSRLSGSLTIPDGLTAINNSTFADCTLLDEIIIGENITKIEGDAFGRCYNLTSIVVNNPEPPLLTNYQWDSETRDPFYMVPKDNFTLQVPGKSVSLYAAAKGWKEFKRIAEYSNFVCRPSTACALPTAHQETLVLNSDGAWEVTHIPDWCSISKTSGNGKTELNLTIKEMQKGSGDRSDYIEFALKGTDFTARCAVSQYDYEYDEDQCLTLQKATSGSGIDILFVGDGFDGEAISKGEYLNLVNKQMEAFFGVEPYSTYRDYFNVYACVSLSQETGVNTANTWRNTRFMTLYAYGCDGTGNLVHDDMDAVFDYAVSHSPLNRDKMNQSLIIMALNSDEYGGSTSLTWDGSAISICSNSSDPYPSDVRGIVQHEACGHGFGKLAEEKISKNMYITQSEKNTVQEMQDRGWYQNISLTGKMADVHWSHFIFDPRYSVAVDVYEGAFGYTRGVYRSELNSCMNYGIPYFNAISRQDIMRRILEYSGEGFTMEKFYATDSDKWGATGSTRAAIPDASDAYVNSGMHHPVRIVKSKKY